MEALRRLVRICLRALVRWSGYHPIRGYGYHNGATIFPRQNLAFLQAPDERPFNEVFFNLWDEIVIEEGAAIAHQVMFLTGRHDHDGAGVVEEALPGGPIRVRKRAWVGSRAIILGGVEIGEGAIVGAGAVVTSDVPAGEFWAGNPAKLVRRLDPSAQES